MKKDRILSSQLKEHEGESVVIAGWLHTKRRLGGIIFIVLRDRHGVTQVVIQQPDLIHTVESLQDESILYIRGTVTREPRAQGGYELHAEEIQVEVATTEPTALELSKPLSHESEHLITLFDHRVLSLRNLQERNIFRIQMGVSDAIRDFLKEKDFTEFHSPKLLAEATEGGAEVFKLDYFGKQATLAQSAQFYKQIMAGVFERVFEFGATYRAEPSSTTRHMTEFITVDVEMAFIQSSQDVMDLLSEMIVFVSDHIWKTYEEELLSLQAVKPVLRYPIPQITLEQLHALYSEATGTDTTQEKDPTPDEERWACQYAAEHLGSEAVFISEFPASAMKFYHYKSETNDKVTERADLLFRGVEIVTLSRREHRYTTLIQQLKAIGGDPEDPGFKHYLMAFKHGMPSHGGFGLGLERLTQKLIGLKNVKEATLFPRDMNRLSP